MSSSEMNAYTSTAAADAGARRDADADADADARGLDVDVDGVSPASGWTTTVTLPKSAMAGG